MQRDGLGQAGEVMRVGLGRPLFWPCNRLTVNLVQSFQLFTQAIVWLCVNDGQKGIERMRKLRYPSPLLVMTATNT